MERRSGLGRGSAGVGANGGGGSTNASNVSSGDDDPASDRHAATTTAAAPPARSRQGQHGIIQVMGRDGELINVAIGAGGGMITRRPVGSDERLSLRATNNERKEREQAYARALARSEGRLANSEAGAAAAAADRGVEENDNRTKPRGPEAAETEDRPPGKPLGTQARTRTRSARERADIEKAMELSVLELSKKEGSALLDEREKQKAEEDAMLMKAIEESRLEEERAKAKRILAEEKEVQEAMNRSLNAEMDTRHGDGGDDDQMERAIKESLALATAAPPSKWT